MGNTPELVQRTQIQGKIYKSEPPPGLSFIKSFMRGGTKE